MKLHHIKLPSVGVEQLCEIDFDNIGDLITYVLVECTKENIVYLVSIGRDSTFTFCNEDIQAIARFIEMIMKMGSPKVWATGSDVFLQEYKSYEAAYDVAFMMVEGISALCYDDPNLN